MNEFEVFRERWLMRDEWDGIEGLRNLKRRI